MYYDRHGKQISMAEWAALLESDTRFDYRRVKVTDLGDDRRLSTVWLGLDHDFMGNGPPQIFETMLFPEQDCRRWSTEQEAIEGHDQWLAELELSEK